MRHTSLIEYALIALVIVLSVSAAFEYVWPIADVFAQLGNVIGSALAGTK